MSALLMGLCMAAIGELIYLNSYASTKLTNTVDGQVGASRTLRRITGDIRGARIVGNLFASSAPNMIPDQSAASLDPYKTLAPSGGWPGFPWPTIPYQLSSRTLILQLPTYYKNPFGSDPLNGFPLMQTGVQGNLVECVDTLVYQLVESNTNPDTFDLQVACFPGNPAPLDGSPISSTGRPLINPPMTILTGIVGPTNPIDGTNIPSIFQYLSAPNVATFPGNTLPATIVGVSINMEVQTPASGAGTNIRVVPVHVEAFLKSSSNLRMSN